MKRQQMSFERDLMTVPEAANYMAISYNTIRNLMANSSEKLPPYVHIGRQIRFSKKTIDNWIKSKEMSTSLKM